MKDEFDEYHEVAMSDPVYAEAFRRAGLRRVEDARERRLVRLVRRIKRGRPAGGADS